jgi:hypothetical protein
MPRARAIENISEKIPTGIPLDRRDKDLSCSLVDDRPQANAHCVKARGFFWSACDCLAYQTHVILWSKDGQTTVKNKRASLHQIDWNVATEGAQPA